MGGSKKRADLTAPPLPAKKGKPSTLADDDDIRFVGSPIPPDEAKSRWPHRYHSKNKTSNVSVTLSDGTTELKEFFQATCHYSQALVDGVVFELNDDAYIQAGEGIPDYIGKIVEMFDTVNKETYICAQWFYRAKDTVIKGCENLIHHKRVFYSDVKNDNPLTCIIRKAHICKLTVNMNAVEKEEAINSCEQFYDMMYSFPHAFTSFNSDNETPSVPRRKVTKRTHTQKNCWQAETTVLDLYSGCGALSSGLCIGALLGGESVVTRWALDFNSDACESLKHNHPNTQVWNEDAKDFLVLLNKWEGLCKEFDILGSKEIDLEPTEIYSHDSEIDDFMAVPSEEYEVEKLVAICYGNPNKVNKPGLHFKVHWRGYGSDDDTWEPIDGLSNCKEKIKEFVIQGHKARLLPLPGDVDFICGGPPCQGMSGYNRYRNVARPLEDNKNSQLLVYMDIIEFLKPRFILMENVTDILKFSEGHLINYAVGRLVSMNYQARLGIMAAGAYGVPQCRMRVFLWGAGPKEILPQFPLPTHKIMKKSVVINEFKENIVGHGNENNELLNTVLLGDVITDLPEVTNSADQDKMPYGSSPCTAFQKFIRMTRHDVFGYDDGEEGILYDHFPLKLNEDDFERVCLIPKEKGANFRNLSGVIVHAVDNRASLDPTVDRAYCKSGKPLVPEYALTFEDGKSVKPFGRLSMDDIVPTVNTRAKPHNQIILHWDQDRVLSIRESARLQGFPDCYKFYGKVKERYIQIGNAVSFAVSIPLGYCLAKAIKGDDNATPLRLPFKFPDCLEHLKSAREKLEESNISK